MALVTGNKISFPNAGQAKADMTEAERRALAIEEYTGTVESTIARLSAVEGWVPKRQVRGTSTITNYAVGESALKKLVPGQIPDPTPVLFSKASVSVDTTILARATLPDLDVFQTNFDARAEIGREHGKKIAKFNDQAFFIMAAKAGMMTESPYKATSGGGLPGHDGGNQVQLAAAGDQTDPVKLYKAISSLCTKFRLKDIDPTAEDIAFFLRPDVYEVLLHNEYLISSEYITSEGNKVQNGMVLKAFGVPVIMSNNVPSTNITGHDLSNASNDNAYDGDFSKLVAQAFSPRALLAGETISLQTKVWFDDESKMHYVDAWEAFGVGPNRPEYAGVILAA